MNCVIDASVTLSWCFADELTPASRGVLDRVVEAGAMVPFLWTWEVANALLHAERRKRISATEIATRLSLLESLAIEADSAGMTRVWSATLDLARAHRLTVYDAAYLELAARRALPLASLDEELTAAAKKIGVAVLI